MMTTRWPRFRRTARQLRYSSHGTRAAKLAGVLALVATPAFAACGGQQSALNPHGRGAGTIADLWWIMFWTAAVVFVLVMLYLLVALFRRRDRGTDAPLLSRGGEGFVIIFGGAIPAAILLVLFSLFVLPDMSSLSAQAKNPQLTIEVIGHQWWWEVRYPNNQVVTANEIHIPVGATVQVQLTSDDVIHSFWVPSLQAKEDVIPGQTTTVSLTATSPGSYRGQCAEYCGLQHAHMAFFVIADQPGQFQSWLQKQQAEAPYPTDPTVLKGEQVFLGSACVYCHTIRGTNASGEIGPDLTHLASRQTIAAGTLPNNPGTLAGWITDPQHIKPGNKMPPTNLSGADLQALLSYLNTLK